MEVVYTGEDMPETFTKSIFLAGPSLRPGQEEELESWRKEAIQILEAEGFDGVVFCPENRGFEFKNKDFNYDDQVEWEDKYLNVADCIVFWVPRDLSLDKNDNIKLPAFTTNVEWGAWAASGKVVFGAPPKADKNTYLIHYAEKYNVPLSDTLSDTLDSAMKMLGSGAERTGGERYVPLFIWNTPSFQSWYQELKGADNRLDGAQLLYSFRPRFKSFVFMWILKVNVFISSENRNKTNEFVLSRTDISSVCMFHKVNKDFGYKVVLVKEFRSPARTSDGFIRELPGGSSASENPEDTAAEEVLEETGFYLDPSRLTLVNSRQLCGTLSSHKSSLYAVELDLEEVEWFESQQGITHGKEEDSERTFIEVVPVQELLKNNLVDWSTLGQILNAIHDAS